MRNTRAALILAGLLAIGFAAGALIARNHSHTDANELTVTAPAVTDTSPSTSTKSSAAGGSARQRLTLRTVINNFALAYAVYMDGSPATGMGRYGTAPTVRQATLAGRIPVDLRDGGLRIASTNDFARTCCSAQETIVLTDRSESYPFTVQLLFEQNRWQVTDLTPADLSIDRHLPKPVAVHTPASAAAAARAFAIAYVRYRAGEAGLPAALTAAGRTSIAQDTDSLAGTQLPDGTVRLVSVAYGPPSGGELAATATVKDSNDKQTFSFLMTHTTDGWVCGAFL